MSINDFKNKFGISQIDVKRNESTGKHFFVYGFETGPVSKKIETGGLTTPVISEVCSADTGEMFYLLHQQGENHAVTLATIAGFESRCKAGIEFPAFFYLFKP